MRPVAPIEAQLAHAAKELERMLQLYPGMVRTGVMPGAEASAAIELQADILNTLRQVAAERAARSVPLDQAIQHVIAAAQHLRVVATPHITPGDRAL
jgi:hypothetical protein